MPSKPWFEIVDAINPYTFKISTPGGSGTGFQIFLNERGICGIATAYHVIDHADEWLEPIKLVHFESKEVKFLKETERVIYKYPDKDLAIILFNKGELPLKSESPVLLEKARFLKQGAEIAWCGFPSVQPDQLCFFAGHVSSYLDGEESYLVDGVAINGVSGGPAFACHEKDGQKGIEIIVGVMTAYMPNRATGETLPGLSVIRSVASYEEDLKKIKSLSEAEKQKEEQATTDAEEK